MRRGVSFALAGTLLVLLVASVIAETWLLPAEVAAVVATFPETAPIAVAAIVWGVAAIACWQAVGVICLRLLLLAPRGRAYRWIGAIVGCLLAFVILDVSAFIALSAMDFATPGVMLGLIFGGLVAVIGICVCGRRLLLRPSVLHPSHS